MFEIKPAYPADQEISKWMVVDEERDVWLQRIGMVGFDEPLAEIFKLVWGGRVIPFEVQYTVAAKGSFLGDTDESSTIRFLGFGGSSGAYYKAKIPAYQFESDEEREAAMLLAVEAMLAFGSFYNGGKCPNGLYRFEHQGKTYIKSDFGLP